MHTSFSVNGQVQELGLDMDPSLNLSEYLKRYTPFKVSIFLKACMTKSKGHNDVNDEKSAGE